MLDVVRPTKTTHGYVSWLPEFRMVTGDVTREAYRWPMSAAPTPLPADARVFSVQWPVVSDSFDPSREYVPRSDRPEEWTAVGALRQLPVVVDAGVRVGDYVGPSETPGHGARLTKKTSIDCIQTLQPYDAERGYSVALCWVST